MRHPQTIDYAHLKNESAKTYDGWMAYGRSKLSQILMSKVCTPSWHRKKKYVRDLLLPQALAARFPQSAGVSFYANHPGLVDTGDGAAAALNAHDFFWSGR